MIHDDFANFDVVVRRGFAIDYNQAIFDKLEVYVVDFLIEISGTFVE